MDYIQLIKEKKPIIQCITNIVTVNDCANALLAIGASPTMAHHPEEMAEIQAGCDALVCNLGATECFDAMLEAAKQAKISGHPMVIDPVGCGGSTFRREFFKKLIELCKPACIRGNYSEIMALAKDAATATGVDCVGLDVYATEDLRQIEQAASKLSVAVGCVVVATGEIDIIADGDKAEAVYGGDTLLKRITGAGCMASSLMGAYLAVDNSYDSIKACCVRMKKAGEEAARITREAGKGTMTFREKMIDALYVQIEGLN